MVEFGHDSAFADRYPDFCRCVPPTLLLFDFGRVSLSLSLSLSLSVLFGHLPRFLV